MILSRGVFDGVVHWEKHITMQFSDSCFEVFHLFNMGEEDDGRVTTKPNERYEASRLLLAADVEQNPGPDRDMDTTAPTVPVQAVSSVVSPEAAPLLRTPLLVQSPGPDEGTPAAGAAPTVEGEGGLAVPEESHPILDGPVAGTGGESSSSQHTTLSAQVSTAPSTPIDPGTPAVLNSNDQPHPAAAEFSHQTGAHIPVLDSSRAPSGIYRQNQGLSLIHI